MGLLEELDERDVDHHAAGESEREGEQTLVGSFGEEGDGASDSGCETGSEGQQQGCEYVVFFHRVSNCGCLRAKIVHKTEEANRVESVFLSEKGFSGEVGSGNEGRRCFSRNGPGGAWAPVPAVR